MEEDTADERRTPPDTGLGAVLADKLRQGDFEMSAAVDALCYLVRAYEPLVRYEDYINEEISMLIEQSDLIKQRPGRTINATFDDAGNVQKSIRELRRMIRKKT